MVRSGPRDQHREPRQNRGRGERERDHREELHSHQDAERAKDQDVGAFGFIEPRLGCDVRRHHHRPGGEPDHHRPVLLSAFVVRGGGGVERADTRGEVFEREGDVGE